MKLHIIYGRAAAMRGGGGKMKLGAIEQREDAGRETALMHGGTCRWHCISLCGYHGNLIITFSSFRLSARPIPTTEPGISSGLDTSKRQARRLNRERHLGST